MPLTKFTMLFEHVTNPAATPGSVQRIGGWSESWYNSSTNFSEVLQIARDGTEFREGILPARAGLLPIGSRIVGQRLQQVDPVGRAQTASHVYPGSALTNPDIPQMALLYTVPATNGQNIRRHVLRGLPDARVEQGEYAPSVAFTGAFNLYRVSLGNWRFRGRDLAQPSFPIDNVTTAGVVTTQVPHGYAVDQYVRVLRTLKSDGAAEGGRFRISTVGPGALVFTLANWTLGPTTGGRVRMDSIIFPDVNTDQIAIGRVITRRVGRPFTQYRGRRSRSSAA